MIDPIVEFVDPDALAIGSGVGALLAGIEGKLSMTIFLSSVMLASVKIYSNVSVKNDE